MCKQIREQFEFLAGDTYGRAVHGERLIPVVDDDTLIGQDAGRGTGVCPPVRFSTAATRASTSVIRKGLVI